jgi:transposase
MLRQRRIDTGDFLPRFLPGGAMAFVDAHAVSADVRVVNLGPLAVLRPLIDQLDIAAIIDRHIPTDAEFSHGTVLAVLLAGRLHGPTALVNLAQWAKEHGVEYLWNIPADKLNDDRLARALDAFFEQRHAILADITHEVLRRTELSLHRAHFDTTHLVLYGAYEASRPRPTSTLQHGLDDLRQSPAHITRGYLTRYKMLQLGLTSVVDDLGPVPVACHLFDGNRNGHTGIKEQYQLLRDSLQLPDDFLLVSDRGTCSAEHLARLLKHQHYAICAGQWQDYRHLFDQHAEALLWSQASYLSQEQQRRRDTASTLPREEYRLAVLAHQLVDPTTHEPFDCRVIFVHSSAAAKECQERRERNIAIIQAGLDKVARKLERAHPTTTPESVTRQITRLLGVKAAAKHFRWQLVPLSVAESTALPAPKKGFRRQSHRLEYSFDAASAHAETRHDGVYALVSTAPLRYSGDALFTEYKRQIHVERGHHELKTPLAVTPVFLKTPHRVEALVSLLFVALQVYMTLERLYRQRVPREAAAPERRMTAEKILRTFRVCGITVSQRAYGELVRATDLSAEQRCILHRLSLPTPAHLLTKILEPPPTS